MKLLQENIPYRNIFFFNILEKFTSNKITKFTPGQIWIFVEPLKKNVKYKIKYKSEYL